ncbi:MAG: M15 family metallopeptidase [Firmicutes bacterium]|nr:M15 family metallopeptidase [Bacillota bacterium]
MRRILILLLLLWVYAVVFTGCLSKDTSVDTDEQTTVKSTFLNTALEDTTENTSVITQYFTEDTTETASVITQEPSEDTTHPNEADENLNESIPDDGQLVNILDYIPDAEIDLRYATTNNFTGKVIYDNSEAFLCYGTVRKLILVQKELKDMGYRILIWDAYRSPQAQWKLWETYPDPTYVANPNKGITSHSRGDTVDISLVYEDGSAVEMPSEFDEFTTTADRDYSDVSETAATNARLLEEVMYRNGFSGYRGEWWDYSDIDRYELDTALYDKLNTENME